MQAVSCLLGANSLMRKASKAWLKGYVLVPVVVTLLYWYWESKAAGNIRVDLLVIYPVLFVTYIAAFWSKFRYYSVLISTILMGLNYSFALVSYDLFDKYPG